jgi:cytochrome P450
MSAISPAQVSLATAATHPNPYPHYAELTAHRPFGRDADSGLWVAAAAGPVAEVLAHPDCLVRPAAGLAGTVAGTVVGRLVRFTDGPATARRKRTLAGALGALDAHRIRLRAAAEAAHADGWPDIQFGVPVRVVGALLGITGAALAGLPALVGEFVRGIPGSAGRADIAAASEATGRLRDLVASGASSIGSALRTAAGADATERAAATANLVGLLSQTYEATAGLIGTTLVLRAEQPEQPAPPGPVGIERFIEEVARYDAPVQNTRRFTAAEVLIAGRRLPAGAEILVLLAAANRDPAANPEPDTFRADRPGRQLFTFGHAAHRCPGQVLATAITAGVLDATRGTPAWSEFRASGNARIPVLAGRPA